MVVVVVFRRRWNSLVTTTYAMFPTFHRHSNKITVKNNIIKHYVLPRPQPNYRYNVYDFVAFSPERFASRFYCSLFFGCFVTHSVMRWYALLLFAALQYRALFTFRWWRFFTGNHCHTMPCVLLTNFDNLHDIYVTRFFLFLPFPLSVNIIGGCSLLFDTIFSAFISVYHRSDEIRTTTLRNIWLFQVFLFAGKKRIHFLPILIKERL